MDRWDAFGERDPEQEGSYGAEWRRQEVSISRAMAKGGSVVALEELFFLITYLKSC